MRPGPISSSRKITVDGLPAHPYVVIEPDGSIAELTITVTTANIGDAPAAKSSTNVKVERPGKVIGRVHYDVPRLLPGHFARQTVHVNDVNFTLGHYAGRRRTTSAARSVNRTSAAAGARP